MPVILGSLPLSQTGVTELRMQSCSGLCLVSSALVGMRILLNATQQHTVAFLGA